VLVVLDIIFPLKPSDLFPGNREAVAGSATLFYTRNRARMPQTEPFPADPNSTESLGWNRVVLPLRSAAEYSERLI